MNEDWEWLDQISQKGSINLRSSDYVASVDRD